MAIIMNRSRMAIVSKRLTPVVPLYTAASSAKPTSYVPTINGAFKQFRSKSDAKIQVLSAKGAQHHLANQRVHRPISPHLGIYKWQMESIMSSMMRITGVIYSGSFYLFGLVFLASPYLGWNLSTASIVAAFGALPFAAKSAIKVVVAWPFVLHCINGVRHLVWDTARGFNHGFIMRTGWAAVGATTLSVAYMVFGM